MSLEFARKLKFKLKKVERPIYVRNINSFFNKERLIKHMVEVNIYYQEHRERMKINVISGQKWSVILGMPQFVCHNPEIYQRTEEVKMMRCPEECGKQWPQRPKQGKSEWQKQKEEKEQKRKEKTKEEENDGSEENSRGMGDLG